MTATEALRQCIEAMKLVDFKDCAESAELWHKFNLAQANAERVLRDGEKQEHVGTVNHYSSGSVGVSGQAMLSLPHGTKLYTHPAPSLPAVGAASVDDVLNEMQPGGALYQPPSEASEKLIADIAMRMERRPWGIGSRREDAIAFAWEIIKALPQPAAAPSGDAWISVDDRMPEPDGLYLVMSNWGVRPAYRHKPEWARGCFQDAINKSDEGMNDFDGHCSGVFRVTHWMPMPSITAITATKE